VRFASRKRRVDRLLRSKESRSAFVFENIKRMIPFQLRTMRDERGWSQAQAGDAIGKPQNVISRLESPAYGKLTLQTLLDIANGFDVGLLIKFVPFSRLVDEYEDVSAPALSAPSVSYVDVTGTCDYQTNVGPYYSHTDVDRFRPKVEYAPTGITTFDYGDTSTFLIKLERRPSRIPDVTVATLPPITNTDILDYTSHRHS
jgi:transcriptional regulator with XRE-family HTH domain